MTTKIKTTQSLPLIIIDTIIEQLQRGYVIPINPSNYTQDLVFLSYIQNKGQYYLYSESTGKILIVKENIIENFKNGTYRLGYTKCIDKLGNTLFKNDKVIINGKYIGIIKNILIDPLELLKLEGYDEYKGYIKYEHILKPKLIVKIIAEEYRNPFTKLNEFKSVKEYEETIYFCINSTIKID